MIRPKHLKVAGLILLLLVLLTAGALRFLPHLPCPAEGAAVTPDRRAFMRLKNRVGAPTRQDFDEGVSLEALLRPGEDRGRWSESRAGRVEGYVVEVVEAGAEAANCFSPAGRDTHIHIAARPDAPARETAVLEVTPRLERWAARRGLDWSEATLRRELLGRWCRFEGWLFFDAGHAGEAENTAPGAGGNWRATAWEIHPITRLTAVR